MRLGDFQELVLGVRPKHGNLGLHGLQQLHDLQVIHLFRGPGIQPDVDVPGAELVNLKIHQVHRVRQDLGGGGRLAWRGNFVLEVAHLLRSILGNRLLELLARPLRCEAGDVVAEAKVLPGDLPVQVEELEGQQPVHKTGHRVVLVLADTQAGLFLDLLPTQGAKLVVALELAVDRPLKRLLDVLMDHLLDLIDECLLFFLGLLVNDSEEVGNFAGVVLANELQGV
mmetsp:Transcript_90185/g.254395  ORF Transcript_90185/g.254395 Transcript_90185/m.254395 type:complete len:226 (+) Transcript_90185:2282-2959(+)